MIWPEAEEWIQTQLGPVRAIELVHDRPWSKVWRLALQGRVAWFKACGPEQAFEPRLTRLLFERWPDRVTEVLAADDVRAWLLLADAGTQVRLLGNPPEAWLAALPRYAELQLNEATFAEDHLAHGVPDQRMTTWRAGYAELLRYELPLEPHEVRSLAELESRFVDLCGNLAGYALQDTIQHDDLHFNNLFTNGERLRVLDWGDSSISHPFVSLVVTFRFLEEFNKLAPSDAWFGRLRDAYLEPWGAGLQEAFQLAMRVGGVVHCFGWMRQRDVLPIEAREEFDTGFRIVLRRAIAQLRLD